MVPKHLHFYSKIYLVNFHLVSDLQILLFITMEICGLHSDCIMYSVFCCVCLTVPGLQSNSILYSAECALLYKGGTAIVFSILLSVPHCTRAAQWLYSVFCWVCLTVPGLHSYCILLSVPYSTRAAKPLYLVFCWVCLTEPGQHSDCILYSVECALLYQGGTANVFWFLKSVQFCTRAEEWLYSVFCWMCFTVPGRHSDCILYSAECVNARHYVPYCSLAAVPVSSLHWNIESTAQSGQLA